MLWRMVLVVYSLKTDQQLALCWFLSIIVFVFPRNHLGNNMDHPLTTFLDLVILLRLMIYVQFLWDTSFLKMFIHAFTESVKWAWIYMLNIEWAWMFLENWKQIIWRIRMNVLNNEHEYVCRLNLKREGWWRVGLLRHQYLYP